MSYVKIRTGPCNDIIQNPAYNFQYKVDHFQQHSFVAIENNENVIVTAHTGSGKTAVAKYAIAYTLTKRENKKVVYTSPIKTLSNQKYNEFKQDFEQFTVGLMTGDNKINPNADCIIMTTEILRNALYDINNNEYFENNFLETIGCVIFDEVHYINDPDRGKVWEETINLLHPDIQLVMLSATINKSEEFAAWIGDLKKKNINLIPTSFRVVPLEHYIFVPDQLFKIQDANDKFYDENYDKSFTFYKKYVKDKERIHINDMVKHLIEKDLLQTIFFSFSRANCEKYAKKVSVALVTPEEQVEIRNIFNKYMHQYEKDYAHVQQYNVVKDLISKGVAFHHSGLVPLLKEIIEIIFQKGLIKILFATETFAVGVNMPTRTIVFTELEKFTNGKRRFLHTAEYKQMSGRAGRRGLDTYGHVIILPFYDFPYKEDLRSVMLGGMPAIESKFYVDYTFILKIMQSNTKTIDDFIKGSLYNKDIGNYIERLNNEISELETNIISEEKKYDKNIINKLSKYLEISKMSDKYKQSGISLSAKQQKSMNADMNNLAKDKHLFKLFNDYNAFLQMKQNLNEKINDRDNMKNYVLKEVEKMTIVLKKYKYVSMNDNEILIKGIIASQINECNSLILTEMITNNMFDNLEAHEIVALLSIFINDSKSENELLINDLKVSENVKNNLRTLENIINDFINTEMSLDIHLYHYDYWAVWYEYVEIAYLWTNGKSLIDIMNNYTGIYEGNFIKSMIKLNNLAKDLIKLCKIYGNLNIIAVLETVENKIMRDIVNVNSLYLGQAL